MPATTLFRSILIASLVTSVIEVIASLSLTNTLPYELQNYLAKSESTDASIGAMLLAIVLMMAVLIVAIIGIWKFKKWARTLYVIITIIFIILSPALGPIVMNSWEAMFSYITFTLDGILLTMMFSGTVGNRFQIPESP